MIGETTHNLWDHRLRKRRRGRYHTECEARHASGPIQRSPRNGCRARFREQIVQEVRPAQRGIQLQVHARDPRPEREEGELLEGGHVVPEVREGPLGLLGVVHNHGQIR